MTPTPGHSPGATELVKAGEAGKAGKAAIEKSERDTPILTYDTKSVFLEQKRRVRLTNAQEQKLITAVKNIQNENWVAAQDSVKAIDDPFARRLFNWLWLTEFNADPPFAQTTAFMASIEDWPHQYSIRKSIERSLNNQDLGNPLHVIAWFDANPPMTPDGMRYYLHYLSETGQSDKARETFREFWATALLRSSEQKHFYKHYAQWLTPEINRKRLDTLLFSRQYTNARNLARVMGNGTKKLVEARIALAEDKSGVDWYIRQVPEALQDDPGLLYERLKWRRENNLHLRAIDLLNYPPDADKLSNPSEWWLERHIMARRMLEVKDYKTAYSLAANHRQTSGFSYAQAEWLAGWIALTFNNKPMFAYEHFQNLYQNVKTPISRSRGAFWTGKTLQTMGQNKDAAKWYEIASRHGATFYGQLAAESLRGIEQEHNSRKIQKASLSPAPKIEEPVSYAHDYPMPTVTFEAQKAFNENEMRQAAVILKKAGFSDKAEDFIAALGRVAEHPMDYRLVADFALAQGFTHQALNIAKKASYNGVVLTDHQFPTVYQIMKDIDQIEWSLAHGIMRQESAFNTQAKSSAGARGIMQLMPATARALARKYNIRHSTSWLTSDPTHNVRLGSIYLRDLLERYDGAYVLAIAAYNAGPGRVNTWLRTYGDPREGEIEWINWIELIPIYETRNYVQRVLEAMHVYNDVLENQG